MRGIFDAFVAGLLGVAALVIVILAMLIQALPLALAIVGAVWMLRGCS